MTDLLETLVNEHLITAEQLGDAKEKQRGAKKPILELLLEMDSITEESLIIVASRVFSMSVLDLDKETIDSGVFKIVPFETASRLGVFPLRFDQSGSLLAATGDPKDLIALDDLRFACQHEVKLSLAYPSQIKKYIKRYYKTDDVVYELLKNFSQGPRIDAREICREESPFNVEDVRSQHAPAVRLVNLLISDAVKNRASDIHIDPKEHAVQVRYRIDGDLRDIVELPRELLSALVKRIKIISSLDISEERKPHDGRTSIAIDERKIDLRVATIPTIHGERVELRILDFKEARVEIGKIGFEAEELALFLEAIRKPKGMILVTGPTGAGKNSTIYSALSEIKNDRKSIITLEDPVEYMVDGINQIQVNPVKNLTFANGLRSILRQDPDIIGIGEIRDAETAEMAFRASLTGHLVFTTLHTIDTAATITRLIDIGLDPYLISSSLLLIVAQRLVKRICPACKTEVSVGNGVADAYAGVLEKMGITTVSHGAGCARCNYTGYYGRTAIFEMMPVSGAIRAIISSGFSEDAIEAQARREGVRFLLESGMSKVARGITTIDEISRVVGFSEVSLVKKAGGPRPRKLVAVADDDTISLKLLELSLTKAGFEVVNLHNGEELVAYATREKPDLVITDVTMPKINGFEACRQLKTNLETALIPVMMLTGREDKDSELQGLYAGADDYLTKPFDHDKLIARAVMLMRRA